MYWTRNVPTQNTCFSYAVNAMKSCFSSITWFCDVSIQNVPVCSSLVLFVVQILLFLLIHCVHICHLVCFLFSLFLLFLFFNVTQFDSTRSSSPTECCRLSPWSRKVVVPPSLLPLHPPPSTSCCLFPLQPASSPHLLPSGMIITKKSL